MWGPALQLLQVDTAPALNRGFLGAASQGVAPPYRPARPQEQECPLICSQCGLFSHLMDERNLSRSPEMSLKAADTVSRPVGPKRPLGPCAGLTSGPAGSNQ